MKRTKAAKFRKKLFRNKNQLFCSLKEETSELTESCGRKQISYKWINEWINKQHYVNVYKDRRHQINCNDIVSINAYDNRWCFNKRESRWRRLWKKKLKESNVVIESVWIISIISYCFCLGRSFIALYYIKSRIMHSD